MKKSEPATKEVHLEPLNPYEEWIAEDPSRSEMDWKQRTLAWMEHVEGLHAANNKNPEKTFHYTPDGTIVQFNKKTKIGYSFTWGCTFWRRVFHRPCEFDLIDDDACDHCIHCGHPEERK